MTGDAIGSPTLRGWAEFLALGFTLGLCHGVAETTVLGWYGLALVPGDVWIVTGIYAVLGALGGSLLWWGVSLGARILGRPAGLREEGGRRRWFLAFALLGYAGMACGLIARVRPDWIGLLVSGGAILACLVVAVVVVRRPLGATRLCLALLGVCLLGVGATVFPVRAAALPAAERWLAGSSLFLFALPPLLLALRPGGSAPAGGVSFWRPGVLTLAALVVLELGLWGTIWPRSPGRPWVPGDPPEAEAAPGAPDVVLIVMDTVRADHMDLFGYPRETMPFLADFARGECIVAVASTATSSTSLPSHGSIFTGMYPHAHGGHKPLLDDPAPPAYGYFLRADVPTLAEWLLPAGYRTLGVAGNYGVLSSYGLLRGFRDHTAARGRSHQAEGLSWLGVFRIRGKCGSAMFRRYLPRAVGRHGRWLDREVPPYRRANEINDLALAWLNEHPSGPSFVFLNYFDAHAPYLPVEELDGRFGPRPSHLAWTGYPGHLKAELDRATPSRRKELLDYLQGQYDAQLVFLDREIRRLFEGLKDLGRYDNTMIIVTSDHGESFLEHGYLRHGRTLYEPEISVPLLIKLPRSSRPTLPPSVAHMQFVDIFPTVVETLGGEVPPSVQGASWGRGRDYAMAEAFCRHRDPQVPRRELLAVRMGDWKYIRSSTGSEECYDLGQDPGERRNVLGDRPDLEARAREIGRRRDARIYRSHARHREDREMLDRLRSLGYVK